MAGAMWILLSRMSRMTKTVPSLSGSMGWRVTCIVLAMRAGERV